jgi:hypothetical protein
VLEVAIVTTVLLFVVIVALVLVLVTRRVLIGREEAREQALFEELRPLVVGWLGDPDEPPPAELTRPMDRRRRDVMSKLLARYGSMLRGEARERLIAYVAAQGFVEDTVRELRSVRAWRRGRAARALGDFGSARAVRHLSLVVINDRDPAVRLAATRALGRIDDYKSAAALLMVLPTGRVPAGVVAQSLLDLGQMGLRALIAATRDEDELAREVACRLIGLIGTGSSADGLRAASDALRDRAERDAEPAVRAAALESLARIGDTLALEVVRDALTAPERDVRRAATEAARGLILRELAPDVFAVFVEELRRERPDWRLVRRSAHAWAQLADRLDPFELPESTRDVGLPFLREAAAAAERSLA